MRGQWIGAYHGSNSGEIILNIDEKESKYSGTAIFIPFDEKFPSFALFFKSNNNKRVQKIEAVTLAISPQNGFRVPWNDKTIIEKYEPDTLISDRVVALLKVNKKTLSASFTTLDGMQFYAEIIKSPHLTTSCIPENIMTWDQFKSNISQKSKNRFIYRGQKLPWRLRTTFHRRARYQISFFTNEDVKQLHRRLSAITNHYFDLSIPEENGAFFNLIQHHGYPTPLLDWSHSPYVAAFFAFRDLPINYSKKGNVRIFIFNEKEWCSDFVQIQNLDPASRHFSVMEFIALNNPRLVPQQSVTTVTNIDDIEAFLLEKQLKKGKQYIEAIDIPAKQREEVMLDLKFMGITAGSMFPSIDGVCEEIRESNFDR
jgi:hypothetical protein